MFKIPDELVTQVKAGERFWVSSAGPEIAKLCGDKICIDVPSNKVKLGECFYATATNKLVRRLGLTDNIVPMPNKLTQINYNGKRVA
uniref:Uncharacterized protein n=1 Tax=Pantoea phage Survivor TaxID=3232176 RepID=A0AAU8L0N7_9CAUD